jgi:ATP:ADP antiporter, AAA family
VNFPTLPDRKTGWASVSFFLLLAGYYIVRPLREEMGARLGASELPQTFTMTLLVSLAMVPLVGVVAARFPKRYFIPTLYSVFIASLILFWFCFSGGYLPRLSAHAFIVWISVWNLLLVSLFWSLMIDSFKSEQAAQNFGLIAAGGSLGAVVGPILASMLTRYAAVENLLLIAAAFLAAAMLALIPFYSQSSSSTETVLGGGVLAGFKLLLRSKKLLLLSLFTVMTTVPATVLYLHQLPLISALPSADRTALFAHIDLTVNLISLALQALGTAPVIAMLGVAGTLAVLPAALGASLGTIIFAKSAFVAAITQVVRRAILYAFTNPARETILTTLAPEEKYKAKSILDTVIFRASDALGGWFFHLGGIIGATVPILASLPLLVGAHFAGFLAAKNPRR